MQTPPALDFVKRLATRIGDDDVPDLAAGLAYRFLFAIFPFAIFLAALCAFVAPAMGLGDPTPAIMGALSDNLPADVAAQVRPQLEAVLGTTRPGLLSIGAVTALWAATGGIGAVIKAMNRAYDVDETRGFIPRTAIALGLTVIGSVGILVAFVTIVGGSVLTTEAVGALGVGPSDWQVVSLLRFPVVIALVAVAVAVLFKGGPNVRVSFRWTLVGGAVFAVTWLAATALFGLYVANFASYANTYGALGGVVVLMLWFYLTGLMLLVAAEVTAMLAKDHEPGRIEARRRELAGGPERAEGGGAAPEQGVGAGVPVSAARRRGGDAERPVERAAELRAAGLRAARRPAAGRQDPRPALAIVLAGAVIGAILGRLSGDEDSSATT